MAMAQTNTACSSCEPLAEVSITNQGLARLIEVSLKENFKELNRVIKSRAGFRDLVLDHSHCKAQTLSEVIKDKSASADCLGLPDLTDENVLSGKTKLRPFKAQMTEFRLNQLELDVVTPIQCENLSCKIKVKLKKIDLEGNVKVDYTDKNEAFIPKTKMTLNQTDNVDVSLTAEAVIDPKTGKLNDLIFLTEDKTHIDVKPGSFNFDLAFKKKFESVEKETALHAKYYRKQMAAIAEKMNNATYLEKQVNDYVDHQVFRAWAVATDRGPSEAAFRKKIEDELFSKHGSKQGLMQNLSQMQWPDMNDDQQINAFMKKSPHALSFVPDISDRIEGAHLSAIAENAGFTNQQGFTFALLGVYAANQFQDSSLLVDDFLQPFLKEEIVPLVAEEVNSDLRNLKTYWDQIASVPSLNIQNLRMSTALQEKLAKAKSQKEKESVQLEIKKLEAKINADWIPIDTAVFVDQTSRSQNMLRAQIAKPSPECDSLPRKFSDDKDQDFDLRTELGPKALQEYFDKMAENKKLDFCLSNTLKAECKSIKINFKKAPQISCKDGMLLMDLDAAAKHSLFGVDIEGQVRGEVKNCDGSPCIQLSDSSGRLKNVFLNTFFDSALERGLALAAKSSSNIPIAIPNVSLQKLKSNPQTCNTKLDWEIKP